MTVLIHSHNHIMPAGKEPINRRNKYIETTFHYVKPTIKMDAEFFSAALGSIVFQGLVARAGTKAMWRIFKH